MNPADGAPPYRGGRLVEENDRVVIWEDVFEPGVEVGPHHHGRDYIVVALDEGRLTVTDVSGAVSEFHMPRCEVAYIAVGERGHTHRAVHHGPAPHREIVIEFKR